MHRSTRLTSLVGVRCLLMTAMTSSTHNNNSTKKEVTHERGRTGRTRRHSSGTSRNAKMIRAVWPVTRPDVAVGRYLGVCATARVSSAKVVCCTLGQHANTFAPWKATCRVVWGHHWSGEGVLVLHVGCSSSLLGVAWLCTGAQCMEA